MLQHSLKLLIISSIAIFFGHSSSFAHKPDRCFHTHYGGGSTCKRAIPGKRCTDAKGNKGRCVQGGSFCYCKIYKKSNDDDRTSAEDIIDLGIGIGGAILEEKDRRKHRRERRRHREDEREYE